MNSSSYYTMDLIANGFNSKRIRLLTWLHLDICIYIYIYYLCIFIAIAHSSVTEATIWLSVGSDH